MTLVLLALILPLARGSGRVTRPADVDPVAFRLNARAPPQPAAGADSVWMLNGSTASPLMCSS
jgi:hypothetical protein